MYSLMSSLFSKYSYKDASECLSAPAADVALPRGSISISSTFLFALAREAARLTAVVVFPTPPFGL